MTKKRNLAIVCLLALLVTYFGITLFTSVYTAINEKESMLLSPTPFSNNSAPRPGFTALGDPIEDPRPHNH